MIIKRRRISLSNSKGSAKESQSKQSIRVSNNEQQTNELSLFVNYMIFSFEADAKMLKFVRLITIILCLLSLLPEGLQSARTTISDERDSEDLITRFNTFEYF